MQYFGTQQDLDNSNNLTGVLLINLGSPNRPVCPSLRKYLAQFLTDPRVIELPSFFRQLLVRGIIINVRSHKSAATYRQIWTDQGSPLLIHTQNLANAVQKKLGKQYIIDFAMRYGQPSIKKKIQSLHNKGCRKLIILPMYPQYSGSTTGSVFDDVAKTLNKQRWIPDLKFINEYYQNPKYIEAVCNSVKLHWKKNGQAQKLVISFHGVPQRYVENGDPYQQQCQQTAEQIAKKLKLKNNQWILVFQSRFGAQPWLQPYCDETLKSLPAQGIKSVDIICPGFSADCLETLEEIEQENKEYFIEAGGEDYRYIPCLNASNGHVDLVCDIVKARQQ